METESEAKGQTIPGILSKLPLRDGNTQVVALFQQLRRLSKLPLRDGNEVKNAGAFAFARAFRNFL